MIKNLLVRLFGLRFVTADEARILAEHAIASGAADEYRRKVREFCPPRETN